MIDQETPAPEPDQSMAVEATNAQNIQAGEISGDITMIDARPKKADLVTLWLNEREIEDLKELFVPNAQFDRACTMLRDSTVIVLCGAGTGRTFTGRKLLLHHGHGDIAHLNASRGLGTIEDSELRRGAGYLWWATDSGRFAASHLEQAAHIMRAVESRLVIIADHESLVPREAAHHMVRMSPPNAGMIARAIVNRADGRLQEAAAAVLRCLSDEDPPDKAVRAATYAIDVARGEMDIDTAREMLTQDVNRTFATTYKNWSVLHFTMLLAVAILENQPYDEVAEHAYRLDGMVRAAQLPADKRLTPRKVFAKPKNELLRDISAVPELREHPQHPSREEETVRFAWRDWAEAALCHVWREFLPVQEVLLSWLCEPTLLNRFPEACVNALYKVTVRTPVHEPLRLVERLASGRSHARRKLASWTLVRLAKDEQQRPVVDKMLTGWIGQERAYRKATAAMTYALRFSKDEPDTVIDRMHEISASTTSIVARTTVFHSLLFTLKDAPAHRSTVLRALCEWAKAARRTDESDGPRVVALMVGMWVNGLEPNPDKIYVQAADMIAAHPTEVGVLTERALLDREYGPIALNRLFTLADRASHSTPASKSESPGVELVRVLTLVAPDLRWWQSRRIVAVLCRQHPTRRKQIRWIFKVARRLA